MGSYGKALPGEAGNPEKIPVHLTHVYEIVGDVFRGGIAKEGMGWGKEAQRLVK